MKCKFCNKNRAFFYYWEIGYKKDIPACPICFLQKYEERLEKLPKGLSKIKDSITEKKHGIIQFEWDEKVIWTGTK